MVCLSHHDAGHHSDVDLEIHLPCTDLVAGISVIEIHVLLRGFHRCLATDLQEMWSVSTNESIGPS